MKDEVPLPVALLPAFAAIVLALLPAFGILGVYQSFVLGLAWKWTILSTVAVFLQFVGSTVGMLAAVVVYADLAFPLVMRAFAAIFARIRVD